MSLQLHDNDVSRESRPGLWIFSGKWVVLLPLGVGIFIMIFKILMSLYLDWYFSVALAITPMLLMAGFVWVFVVGKPPSYATDLWLLALWRVKSRLYLAGWMDRPPLLWFEGNNPKHFKEFS